MKENTRQLLEKDSHALRAAQVLLDADEADFAAGRAYYGMLYVAQALLLERGFTFRKHSAVHAAYGKEFAKTGLLDPKFHRWLLTAFDARLQGDYQVVSQLTSEDVESSLEQAKEFLAVATSFLESKNRTEEGSDS